MGEPYVKINSANVLNSPYVEAREPHFTSDHLRGFFSTL